MHKNNKKVNTNTGYEMQVHLTRTETAVHIIRYIRWNTY